jgi:hypothetical protein
MHSAAAYVTAGYIGHHGLDHYSHITVADALTIAMIVSAVEDFGSGHGVHEALHGYGEITLAELPGYSGSPESNADPGRPAKLHKVIKPGIARDKQSFEFTWYFHGKCDPMSEIERLATKEYRAFRIAPNEADPSCLEIDKVVPRVTSNMPLTDPDNKYNKPNGWYEGVSGTTHIWRRFYQLRPSMNWLFGQPKFDIWRTFLVVTGATWHYKSTGDYETRVSFMVYSKPFVNYSGVWTYDWKWVEKHFFLAERLMQGGLKFVKNYPTPPSSVVARKAIDPERYERPAPPGKA